MRSCVSFIARAIRSLYSKLTVHTLCCVVRVFIRFANGMKSLNTKKNIFLDANTSLNIASAHILNYKIEMNEMRLLFALNWVFLLAVRDVNVREIQPLAKMSDVLPTCELQILIQQQHKFRILSISDDI